MRVVLFPCVVVLLLWTQEGLTLNCYQCNSAVDPDCTEKFDTSHISSLTVKPEPCTVEAAKYCIKTTGVWGGTVGTQRFCSSRDMFHWCQYVTYADHNRMYRACIYTCESDNCNSAVRFTPAAAVSSLLALLLPVLASLCYALY
jgi:hypothetical protein